MTPDISCRSLTQNGLQIPRSRTTWRPCQAMAVSQTFIFNFMCYCILHFAACQLLRWSFLSIYRPGSQPLTSEFVIQLTSILVVLATYCCPVLLLGDLNIHVVLTSNEQVTEIDDLISSFDICQLVTITTYTHNADYDFAIECHQCACYD